MAYDNGPAHRAALALEVTKKVTYDAGKRVPPLPMSAEQLATDGALMSIYEKLLRLAQDWLALPEKDREQWSRTMRREAAKHRAPSGDPADADATPKINLPLPRTPKHHSNNSAGPIGTNQKRRHAKKRNGQ